MNPIAAPQASPTRLPAALEAEWPLDAGIRANNQTSPDALALQRWLAVAAHRNAHTWRAYRFEALRFWAFLRLMHEGRVDRPAETLLRDATEADVAAYETTLLGKAPAHVWPRLMLSAAQMREWGLSKQPFAEEALEPGDNGGIQLRALKPSSVNQALNILHALYAFWMEPDPQNRTAYVGANPVRRLKRASVRAQRQSQRVFPAHALEAMLAICERDALTRPAAAARQRWLLCLLFGLWARRAEIAGLRMGDFRHDGKRWIVHLRRKGGKTQDLPLASWVMDALVAYRHSLGLPGLPASDETRAAILPLRPRRRGEDDSALDPATLYREVTRLARRSAQALACAEVLPELGALDRQHAVNALRALSPHWFRHTAASMAIESGAMSLENASRVLGHSSAVVTAAMYYHPEEQQIADGLQRIGGWFKPATHAN